MSPVTVILSAVVLLLPIVLIINLVRRRPTDKVDWLLTAVGTAAFTGYALLVGRWDLASYYLRPLVAVGLVVALVVSLARAWRAPWWTRPESGRRWAGLVGNALVTVLFVGLVGLAGSGLVPRGTPTVQLAAPLRDGVSYVGQGGSSTFVNYHHVSRSQAYAVDIVGLNAAGRNAQGVASADPGDYAIFGRPVHSPCSGTVLEATGSLADLRPPATDRENIAGNHVVLRCVGTQPAVDVAIAHLQQGSLAVQQGDQVGVGEVVGRVGNTGNTSEPHLHVHAILTGSGTVLRGEGVPIRFDGRFLVRNDLIFGG